MKVCEDKIEFENPRHNPLILAASHLTLTVQNFLHLNKVICLGANFRANTNSTSTILYSKQCSKAS